MKKYRNKRVWGITSSSATAVLQGFEGILFLFFGILFSRTAFESIGFSSGSLFLKELVTLLFMIMLLQPSKFKKLLVMLKKKKETRIFLYAGFFGTSLGNIFYIVAIQLGGAGYGVVLSSFYPIFSIFLIKLFSKQKERENWKVWTGVIISVIGAVLFIILPSVINNDSNFTTKTITGMLLGALVGLFWALEGLIIKGGLKFKINRDMSTMESASIRSLSTLFSSVVIFVPLSLIINATGIIRNVYSPFEVMDNIITSWKGLLILIAIAVNLVVLRNTNLYAIKTIGPKLTAIIDTNNFLVPPIVGQILHTAHINYYNSSINIFDGPVWWSWFLIIPILVGVLIVVIYRPSKSISEMDRLIT